MTPPTRHHRDAFVSCGGPERGSPPPVPFTGNPWHEQRFVALDVETTGVDVETARIVTAAVVEVGGRRATTSRTWLQAAGLAAHFRKAGKHAEAKSVNEDWPLCPPPT